MRPLDVVGVRLEMPSNQPVVLLRETGTSRYLPIWIGTVEATAIAFAQEGVTPPRPLTHDLMKDLIDALGQELQEVRITHLADGVFYATLTFASGAEVSARPSDAIALALRTGAPVLATAELLDEAGVEIEDVDAEASSDNEPDPGVQEQEVERFREFLDHVTPEDFDSPG
ncbi:MAG: bifunctional nuclease family protein [Candidatus Nanopelagicales bacterium]